MDKAAFVDSIRNSYTFNASSICLGTGVLNGEILPEAKVNLALRMMNRHGLVSGDRGTGKTRTLQITAEQLSGTGVPAVMPDIKGDLSGLAKAATENEKLLERANAIGIPYKPDGFPVELYSLSGKCGAQMRATITEFGPVLLSKILDL